MAQNLANYDAALKDDYGPGLKNSINNKSAVWANVAVNDEDIQGRQAVWSVHTSRSGSTGARGDGIALPTAGNQGFSQVRDNLAALYHTIKVTGPAIELSQGDSGAFTKALEQELKGAEKDFANDCARQAFNDTVTVNSVVSLGALFSAVSTTVSTVTWTFAGLDPSLFRHVFVGMPVDVINGSTGAVRGSTTIASVTPASSQLTLAAATSGATGDYLARSGNFAAATTWGYEMNGLPFILSATKPYANLDPATVPAWAGNAIGTTTTGISDVIFERANDLVNTDGDGGDINLWIAETSQRTKLAQVNVVQRRIDSKVMTLPSGWKGVELEQGTLVTDKYCPTSKIFGINTSEIARFVGLDFSWDDIGQTSILYKSVDDTDAVSARFKAYQNLEATNRNSHVVVTLAVPTF